MMRDLIRRQDGMTMVEVVVAMLILAIGSLAVLSLISTAAHSSYRNEQSQVISDRLQQEMERIRAYPYDRIALTGLPANSTDPLSPASRVQGTNYAVNRNGTDLEPLAYDGSALYGGGSICDSTHECGVVDPTPTHFTSGSVSGTIYRYVVWENDPTCPDASCPGSQDLKRIVVAILLDSTPAGGVRAYHELDSEVTDPTATHGTNPTPPPQNQGTPWTFWLTDTPCSNTTRQDLTGDHLVHNTRGTCPMGKRDSSDCSTSLLGVTSCPLGSPDLMVTNPPTLNGETPLYNYSTDLSPDHKGLLLAKPTSTLGNGCLTTSLLQLPTNLVPDSSTTNMQTIHKWVSNPMGNGFNVTLTGKATLDLWTQSVNAAAYAGNLCIWLFTRTPDPITGTLVDTPVTTLSGSMNAASPLSCSGFLSYYQCSESTWPTGWTELHIPLNFNTGLTLGPTTRLGLAIQVERSGTTGGGMEFLYDEPSFDSRLQINSSTSLLPF